MPLRHHYSTAQRIANRGRCTRLRALVSQPSQPSGGAVQVEKDPGGTPLSRAMCSARRARGEKRVDIAEHPGAAPVEQLVGAVGPVTYPNGDVTRYMDTAVRCSVVGDSDEPVISDDENTEAAWFSIMHMPPMNPRFRLIVGDAVAQLRRPEGFRPRMGYVKRDRTR